MKSPTPVLLPLLRSRIQGEVMAWLVLNPDQEPSLSELAVHLHTSAPTVMREVQRLADAGLIKQRRRGNQRVIRVETTNALYPHLAAVMALTYGPVPVLTGLLKQVNNVQQAFIYGSWAARYANHPGPVPADIDVLVIGTASLGDLDEVAETASVKLLREVNIRRVRPTTWHNSDDPFKTTVLSRPTVELELT